MCQVRAKVFDTGTLLRNGVISRVSAGELEKEMNDFLSDPDITRVKVVSTRGNVIILYE